MSFIPEKMNSIERALVAAASMAPSDARNVLRLICEGGMTTTVALNEPSEGDRHYAKREKFIKRMKSSTDRVCDYARHETLRNIEKHFRENPQHIKSAEGEDAKPSSLAARLTFDRSSFSEELLAALAEDQQAAMQTSGQQLFDEIGKDSVWRLPSQDALQFIEDRANLLANVPDEIHREIMDSIEQGLANGESRKDLMARISTAFDEIGKGRSETIANTETAAAFNYSRDKAMREAGVTHKRWLHSQSPLIKEPRPTHVEADGQVLSIDDPFDVGGVQFMRPADDSLGAGPEDIINCHCVAIPVEVVESVSSKAKRLGWKKDPNSIGQRMLPDRIDAAGEKEGHPFRGNQFTGGKPMSSDEAKTLLRESLTPKAAAVGIPDIEHNEMGNVYQFGYIKTPLDDHPTRVQSKLLHEYGHHVDRMKHMSGSPEFQDVVNKSISRAHDFAPTTLDTHINHRISGENEELLKSALLKTPAGQSTQTHGTAYLDKFQNKEVFAIGFGEHQRANTNVRKHFPELHAYMEKHFRE